MRRLTRALSFLIVAALAVAGAAPALAQQVVQPAAPMGPQAVLSPESTALLEAGLAGTLTADMELTARGFLFPSTGGGGGLYMLGFKLAKAELMFGVMPGAAPAEGEAAAAPRETAGIEIFGALLQNGAEVRRIGTDARLPKEAGTITHTATFSIGETLPAGAYELVWGVRDSVSGKSAMRRDEFEVPDFMGGGLDLSSVLMFQGNPVGSPGNFQANTVFYGVKIFTAAFMDELTHEFPRDSSVMLAYLVSGAKMSGNAYSLELSYRILDSEGEVVWRAQPQKQDRTTVGQPLPFGDIAEVEADTDYVLEIVVKDLVDDSEISRSVPFRLTS